MEETNAQQLRDFVATSEHLGDRSDDCLKMTSEVARELQSSEMQAVRLRGGEYFRLTDELSLVLVESLVANKISLRCLSLRHHRLTDVGAIQLCQLVLPDSPGMKPLLELDLEGNDIEATGCGALRECLQSSSCELTSLNLSWNALEPSGGLALAEALKTNKSLKTLQLANCDFDLSTLVAITTSLSSNSSLTSLTLDRPVLSTKQEENADHLSRLLCYHNSIQHLSLRYSRIGCHSCHLFSQELKTNTTLLSLNLECNSIGIKGAEALASYLIEVNNLRSLKLSSNRICNDGAVAMAAAIRSNISLEELTLRHNEIDQDGLVAIGNALYKNSTLKELSLWGNLFDDVSCGLFHDLYDSRIPYVGLSLDCKIYIVDSIHCVAEKSL